MRQPTFLEGAVVAVVASVSGAVLLSIMTTLGAGGIALRLVVAAVSAMYILYLLRRSKQRVGRIVCIAAWFTVAAGVWFAHPSLVIYVAAHVGLIWLIRSLYFYSSVLPALADLGLNVLSLALAAWAAMHTGSVMLSLWCFFLAQALFAFIPAQIKPSSRRGQPHIDFSHVEDRFQRAHRAAESAVHKLSSIHSSPGA